MTPPRPFTLAAWLRDLRRRGVVCRLSGGRVRVSGVRKLTPVERAALSASSEPVRQLLEARARRRKKERTEEQQHGMATAAPERQRRVVGQVVRPGLPLQLLFEDDVKPIPAHARVLGRIPYGWKVGE